MFDIFPHKAQYRPGDEVLLNVSLDGNMPETSQFIVRILHGHEVVSSVTVAIKKELGNSFTVPVQVESHNLWNCFGVDAILFDENGIEIAKRSTAFDICPHWSYAPRYGFLSDFHPDEEGKIDDVEALYRYHVNVVQFYDWMYRHDQLVPPKDHFTDPMGRTLSFKVVKEKINALKERGMAPIAYGALYASLKDFHDQHPDWGLYKRNGEPYQLIDIFYIMDISPDSKWNDHIIQEFKKVIQAGFEGIHLDQYGFPKWAIRRRHGQDELVDLAKDYPLLIQRIKEELVPLNSGVGLIFNNVSNYPIHTTCNIDQEALYIEVWEPIHSLQEIKQTVLNARKLGNGKQTILAAYLPAFNPKKQIPPSEAETGALLTMATIFSNGGYHLLLGEDQKLLTAAYYPDYGTMRESFVHTVRNYYDFIVRYGEFLYPASIEDLSFELFGGENQDILFEGEVPFYPNERLDSVWVQTKRKDHHLFIHLINLVGVDNDCWYQEKKKAPLEQKDIICKLRVLPTVKSIHFMSPDQGTTESTFLPFEWIEENGEPTVLFKVPFVKIWSMIHIEF